MMIRVINKSARSRAWPTSFALAGEATRRVAIEALDLFAVYVLPPLVKDVTRVE